MAACLYAHVGVRNIERNSVRGHACMYKDGMLWHTGGRIYNSRSIIIKSKELRNGKGIGRGRKRDIIMDPHDKGSETRGQMGNPC